MSRAVDARRALIIAQQTLRAMLAAGNASLARDALAHVRWFRAVWEVVKR